MRSRIRVGFMAVCLGLLGCTAAPKKDSSAAAPQPFTGASITRPRSSDTTAAPTDVDSLLAGQVLDRAFNKRLANASIQVVDLQDPNPAPAARLDVTANPDGYFFIPGLQRGHHYQLIGRIKEGDHVLSGTTLAMPPNPRLSIYLSEDFTTPSTPAPLGPPTAPGKEPAPDKTPGSPSASIDPPAAGRTDGGFDPTRAPGAAPPVDRSHVADGNGENDPGGFQRYPAAPKAEIPNGPPGNPGQPQPSILPPPPPLAPSPQVDQTGRPAPHLAAPYCVLVGKHLNDLALNTLDGQTWEFRRDPPRKLVLLDFWKTTCPPCQSAVKYLRGFQNKYGGDGLEVAGIAYEDPGRPDDQMQRLRNARQYLHINYAILIGADSAAGPCPVRSQFLVDSFPRLVLIDGNGDILWRSGPEGMSAAAFSELDWEIDHVLHAPPR